ncbi:hypothetical protein FRC03_002751 [Tulasnella sp. 419]|nr:hypothetical protein FRC03_002751 [Tulasnella sp. 419]
MSFLQKPFLIFAALWSYFVSLFSSSPRAIQLPPDDVEKAPSSCNEPFNLSAYDFDEKTGAFPNQPLERLTGIYSVYEEILDDAMDRRLSLGEDESEEAVAQRQTGEEWRQKVRMIEVLDFTPIKNERRLLQRSHHVLAFLVHFYVHSTPKSSPEIVIPKSLSRPLVDVSRWLGIAPVLTYADTVLWNWSLRGSGESFSSANMVFRTLFNASTDADVDETEFYRCCAWIELRGLDSTKIIAKILDLLDKQHCDKATLHSQLTQQFQDLSVAVQDFTHILLSVRARCQPEAFYSSIRPWYRGDDPADGRRWVYEGIQDMSSLPLSGPSAGQTTTLHALDALLGVEHGEDSKEFMEKMLEYMPKEQRMMLMHLRAQAPRLRKIMEESPEVRAAYREVLKVMTDFRTEHVKVAVRYVVSPKKTAQLVCPFSGAQASSQRQCPGKSRGTGGNELSKLLKASRDATKKSAQWAS